jgi:membrane protein YdbS with pleckstrin-like domain
MRCPSCGEEVVQTAVYCHKCGHRLDLADTGFPEGQPPANQPEATPEESFQAAMPRPGSKDQPEKELWKGGYSSKAMMGAWVISGFVTIALLIGGFFWANNVTWWLVLLVLIILTWLYHFAILCYRRMSVRYLLTSQRFIHEKGLLRRVTDRIEMLDMDDITFEQGPLERLMGVGTIRIASSDRTHPMLVLPGIENVKEVASLFDNTRLAERHRRGLHIEQV